MSNLLTINQKLSMIYSALEELREMEIEMEERLNDELAFYSDKELNLFKRKFDVATIRMQELADRYIDLELELELE